MYLVQTVIFDSCLHEQLSQATISSLATVCPVFIPAGLRRIILKPTNCLVQPLFFSWKTIQLLSAVLGVPGEIVKGNTTESHCGLTPLQILWKYFGKNKILSKTVSFGNIPRTSGFTFLYLVQRAKKKKKKALVWEGCTRGSNIGGEERESKGGEIWTRCRKKTRREHITNICLLLGKRTTQCCKKENLFEYIRLLSSDRRSTMVCSPKDDCDKREANHGFFFAVLLSSSVNEGALEWTMITWISFSYRRFLRVLLITFSLWSF